MTIRIDVTKGSPSTRFVMHADIIGQSVAGNFSTVRCYLECFNAGNSSSFFNGAGTQAGSIDGLGSAGSYSANPFLPSGYANGARRWQTAPVDVNVPHNADGTRGSVTLRMVLNYGTIDEAHTAAFGGFQRIPRGPRIRVGGVHRHTVGYLRVGGVHRLFIPYVKDSGVWRIGGG